MNYILLPMHMKSPLVARPLAKVSLFSGPSKHGCENLHSKPSQSKICRPSDEVIINT